jgi:hypothetical protein
MEEFQSPGTLVAKFCDQIDAELHARSMFASRLTCKQNQDISVARYTFFVKP